MVLWFLLMILWLGENSICRIRILLMILWFSKMILWFLLMVLWLGEYHALTMAGCMSQTSLSGTFLSSASSFPVLQASIDSTFPRWSSAAASWAPLGQSGNTFQHSTVPISLLGFSATDASHQLWKASPSGHD